MSKKPEISCAPFKNAWHPNKTLLIIFGLAVAIIGIQDTLLRGGNPLLFLASLSALIGWFILGEYFIRPAKIFSQPICFAMDEIFFFGIIFHLVHLTGDVQSCLRLPLLLLAVAATPLFYPPLYSIINTVNVSVLNGIIYFVRSHFSPDAPIHEHLLMSFLFETAMGTFIGITLTGLMKSLREKTCALVRTTEQKYESFFDESPLAVKFIEPDGRISFANKTLKNFIPEEEKEKQNWNMLDRIDPSYSELYREKLAEAFAGKPSLIEIKMKPGQSPFEWIIEEFFPLKNERGKIEKVIAAGLDITDKKISNEKEKKLNDAKNNFITTVSHQMRTPASAIRWNMEVLLEGGAGALKPKQKNIISDSHEAIKETISRLDELLMALDIREGNVKINKKSEDLVKIIKPPLKIFASQCASKKIDYTFKITHSAIPVKIDAQRTIAALQKILNNALAYTKTWGKISVTLGKTGRTARFEVSDTGIGIPKEEQPRVFDLFFRSRNAVKIEPNASGVSLYLAKYFIETQGGQIGFLSVPDKGSTFWIDLPLTPPEKIKNDGGQELEIEHHVAAKSGTADLPSAK